MREEVGPSFSYSRLSRRLKAIQRTFHDRDLANYRAKLKSLGVPRQVVEEALLEYSKAKKMGYKKSLLSALKVAALLKAARLYGYPLPLKRALEAFPAGRYELTEAFRMLRVRAADPKIFVPLIVSRVSNGRRGEVLAEAFKRVRGVKLQGRKPQVVAALAVYTACRELGLSVSLRQVARAAEVSYSSLRLVLRASDRFKTATAGELKKREGGPDEGDLPRDPSAGGRRGGDPVPQDSS